MSDGTAVSGATVVLLAALGLAALAMGVWLLLRRRGISGAGGTGADTAGPGSATPSTRAAGGGAATGWAAAGSPRGENVPGDAVGDAEGDAEPANATAAEEDSAEGAEFEGPGLSTLASEDAGADGEPGATMAGEPADGRDAGSGEVSGSAPRTPTQAFGEAEGSTREASTGEERRGSLLDDPGSDSTPLFRSIREQMMASAEKADDAVPSDETQDGESSGIRRVSELHEVVDGGFGIGSAAVIPGGVQPLGHPIKAEVSSKTYQDLHSPGYDEMEPDVWFLDAGFAERAGFRRSD